MRLGKALMVIGVVLVASSFSHLGISGGYGTYVAYGDYEGIIVRNTGSFQLDVHSAGQPFNLYVFGFEEAITVVKNGNISGVSSLYKWENITRFAGTVWVMKPGWYAVLFSPCKNETIGIEVSISESDPSPNIFLTGIVVCGAGLVAIVLSIMLHARKKARAGISGLPSTSLNQPRQS